ncbi:PadR family transcriptional regulator [Streptosporangiaceae bacterium NEAU-GS5]|nr:PadR family transcriptional regulator [Streptosporangiaceae bacterium NEAU-GS5]
MSLRHAVLGLLAEAPGSGYDLMRVFNLSLANVWPATQSQVYGELNRLAEAGLVEVADEGPRGRKEYAVTDAGRAELRHWMIDVEPNRVQRSDLLLRVFFLGQLSRAEAAAYLRREGDLAAREHDVLLKLREEVTSEKDACDEDGERGSGKDGGKDPDGLTTHGLLALEWGLRATRAAKDWADWAVEQLDAIELREGSGGGRAGDAGQLDGG